MAVINRFSLPIIKTISSILGVIVVTGAFIVGIAYAYQGGNREMISKDEAKNKVYEFLVHIGKNRGFEQDRIKQLLGPGELDESPNVGEMWRFESVFGDFSVSQQGGDIVIYSAPESRDAGSRIIIESEAEKIAYKFIKSVYPFYESRNFKLVSKEENDEFYEFEYTQQKKKDEISIFPNFISVAVSGDIGEVTYYACSNLNFIRKVPPKINEDAARKMVESIIKKEKGRINKIELVEVPVEKSSKSITVWAAEVLFGGGKVETSADIIMINADTGARVNGN